MLKLALFVRLEAKKGKEAAVEQVLASGLELATREPGTPLWFALKLGPSTYGVFDAFTDETGRQAHLNGPIAAALMEQASTLFSAPPSIEPIELIGTKLKAA
jgi:quinol monooxygenase YgiN